MVCLGRYPDGGFICAKRGFRLCRASIDQIEEADELSKLAKLRDQGITTEAEFAQMKGNLIKRT